MGYMYITCTCTYVHIQYTITDLTVVGFSSGVSISALLRNTLPRQALHRTRSNTPNFSRTITPVTKLRGEKYIVHAGSSLMSHNDNIYTCTLCACVYRQYMYITCVRYMYTNTLSTYSLSTCMFLLSLSLSLSLPLSLSLLLH